MAIRSSKPSGFGRTATKMETFWSTDCHVGLRPPRNDTLFWTCCQAAPQGAAFFALFPKCPYDWVWEIAVGRIYKEVPAPIFCCHCEEGAARRGNLLVQCQLSWGIPGDRRVASLLAMTCSREAGLVLLCWVAVWRLFYECIFLFSFSHSIQVYR